jgi:hypothetical protein
MVYEKAGVGTALVHSAAARICGTSHFPQCVEVSATLPNPHGARQPFLRPQKHVVAQKWDETAPHADTW